MISIINAQPSALSSKTLHLPAHPGAPHPKPATAPLLRSPTSHGAQVRALPGARHRTATA